MIRNMTRWLLALALVVAASMGRVQALNWGTFESQSACQEYAWGYCMGWCAYSEQACSFGSISATWTSPSSQCTGGFSCS